MLLDFCTYHSLASQTLLLKSMCNLTNTSNVTVDTQPRFSAYGWNSNDLMTVRIWSALGLPTCQ